MWKWAVVAFFGAFFIVLANGWPADQRSINERIEDACREEFRYQGEDAITRCRVEVSTRYILEQERNKVNSAYSRAR